MTHEESDPGWISGLENNVVQIGEKAVGYKIMHVKAAQNARRIFNWLMYTAILVGPLSGLLSGIGATLNPNVPTTFPILSACAGIVSGILVVSVKFAKWEEQIEAHKRAAAQYTSLESNVRRNLAIPRCNRINAVKYIEWVGKSYDDLFNSCPLIPAEIFKGYIEDAKNKGITLPDEYAITITVDAKYQGVKINEIMASHAIDINLSRTPSPPLHSEDNLGIKTSIKRTQKIFTSTPDLNKYDNGNMEYEMERLMGFK
jgi:hypothetical protein